MKIPSVGGVAWSAGVGSFSTPQPTPGPDGPCPSREGNGLNIFMLCGAPQELDGSHENRPRCRPRARPRRKAEYDDEDEDEELWKANFHALRCSARAWMAPLSVDLRPFGMLGSVAMN